MKSEIGRKILVFLLSILILIGFPMFLILIVPLLFFRFVVAKLAQYFQPKLRKMVTTRGCMFAVEDYTKCSSTSILFTIVLDGKVDLEKAKECAGQRLLEARLPNGDMRYPELKQYITTWMGYYFWKDDPKFDIKNHIKIHQVQDKSTEQDLQELRQNMLVEPWVKKRSMWDITFVPNCYPVGLKSPGPHTVLMIRFQHSLGDGYAWYNLIIKELCKSEIKFPVPNYPKRSFFGNILDQILFPFKAAYHYANGLSLGFRRNVPFGKKEGIPVEKYNIAVSNIISFKKMKEISAHFNVCFSSVVSAALAGAIRDLLILRHMEIPTILYMVSNQPLPGHSLKLRNFYTAMILKSPIGEDDPVKRLKNSDANYTQMKASADPRLFKYGLMLMGSYFSWMIKYFGQSYPITSETSNFPGPSNDSVHFNGHKWIDYWFVLGFQYGALGLFFCASSFVNGFRITPIAASGVLSTEEVNELSALIVKHVDILHERIITDV